MSGDRGTTTGHRSGPAYGVVGNRTRRWLRRHAPQRSGRGAVGVAGLISPFRYDVVVRAQLFSFLRANPELMAGDLHDVVAAVREHPYATWYRTLALARFHPRDAVDPTRADRALLRRVRSARSMAALTDRGGVAGMPPITARVTVPGACTESGVELVPRLQLVDGGHRLALLALTGLDVLPSDRYRVFAAPAKQALDNTAALIRPLGIGAERYSLYVSLGLTGVPRTRIDDVLADVAERSPDRLEELERTLDRHGPLLAETDAMGAVSAAGSSTQAMLHLLSGR